MKATRASVRPERAAPWLIYGLIGCLLIALYVFLPGGGARSALYPAFGFSAAVAILMGRRQAPKSDQIAWLCLAMSQAIWALGDIAYLTATDRNAPESSVAYVDELIYVAGYAPLVVCFIALLRGQRGHLHPGGLVDALIVATGVGMLTWSLAISPVAADAQLSSIERLFVSVFPVLDLVVLTLILRLMFGAKRATPALRLCLAGAATLSVASVLYELRTMSTFNHGGGYGDVGWLLSYVSFGAAALHPSMRTIGERASAKRSPFRRIILLFPVVLTGPAALLIAEWRDVRMPTLAVVLGMSVLTLMALWRVLLVLRDSETTHSRSLDVLESIHDAFYSLDSEWRFTFVNTEAVRLLRIPRAELLGAELWTVFPELRETEMAEAFRKTMVERTPSDVVFYFQPLSCWFQVRVSPNPDGLSVYFLDVTEFEESRSALAASELRYRSVVEHVPVAIYAVNCDDVESYGYLGPYVETILGYKTEDFEADPQLWINSVHQDDREQVRAHGRETGETGAPFSLEYRMIGRDGREVWVNDAAVLVRDESGAPLYWQGAVTDITDRKRAQEALAAQDARFRSFVQEASDLITLVDLNGDISYVSPAFERLLGYCPDEWMGRDITSFAFEEDLDHYRSIMTRMLERPREAVTFLIRVKHADGSIRWLEGSGINLADDPNIGGIVLNSRDITERKQLEEDLRLREARNRALLDAIPDVLVRLDRNGVYLDIKSADSVPLLAPIETLHGKTFYEVLSPEVASLTAQAIERALDQRTTQTFEYSLEERTGTRDYEARIVAAGDDEVVALVRDVTRRRAAEARVRESEERLRIALEAAGIGAWDWHLQSDTVIWSATLSSLLGLPPMARATSFAEFYDNYVHPDDRERIRAMSAQLARSDGFSQIDFRTIGQDGSIRSLVEIGRLVEQGPNGEPIRAAGVTIDVTETRAAAAALRLRDGAIAAASSGIVIIDALRDDHAIMDVNPAFERITGLARMDVLGRNLNLLFGESPEIEIVERLNNALSSGAETTIEAMGYRSDGSSFWSELKLAPVLDAEGRLVNVVGILNDVSERRRADRELRFNSDLLDTLSAAVVSITTDGTITHWNNYAETLYGWTQEEAIGCHIGHLLFGSEEQAAALVIKDRLLGGHTWEGELTCVRKDGSTVDVHIANTPIIDASGQISGIVGVSVDISDRKAIEQQLKHQATHDALTGLPNRTLFTERLQQALASEDRTIASVAVLFLDLDGFKFVNDNMGHDAGDQLLLAVANRLERSLDPVHTLSRFGGDEFTLLHPMVKNQRDIESLVQQVLAQFHDPFVIDGRAAHVRASIGVSLSDSTLNDADELMRAADIALYAAKGAGRATYKMFEPGMIEQVTTRMSLGEDLRHAIAGDQLVLRYQPEVALDTEAIVGLSVQVCWLHPTRGLMWPDELMPIAEECDLLEPISEWALVEACRQTAEWKRRFGSSQQIDIGVRVDGRLVGRANFIDMLSRVVSESGLAPQDLTLFVTDPIPQTDLEITSSALDRLRGFGVRLAVDNFGGGSASLDHVRRLRPDRIKIDRASVALHWEPRYERDLIEILAQLGRVLGADVVVKGIETPEQLAMIRELGVRRGEGPLFSEPIPAERIAFLLALEGTPRNDAFMPTPVEANPI